MDQVEENNQQHHDWSSLPLDITNKIGELLPLPNRVYFRMVCKSWCNSVSPVHIPSPWLLFPGDGTDYGEYTDSFKFYSMATNTSFQCPVPPGISGMHYVGSQDGWLVLSDLFFNFCILNPLTGVQINLPPFTNHPNIKIVYDTTDDGSTVPTGYRNSLYYSQYVRFDKFDRHRSFFKKIVFTSDPTPTDFTAVALFYGGNITYTRAGDTMWHTYENGTPPRVDFADDIAFCRGKFWFISPNAGILSLDPSQNDFCEVEVVAKGYYEIGDDDHYDSDNPERGHDPIFDVDKYIFTDDHSNEIFMILRHGDVELHSDGEEKFHTEEMFVMRYNGCDKFPFWDPVKDLGGRSLFVGNNNNISLLAKDSPYSRGDCIFLTHVLDGTTGGMYGLEPFDMGVFDTVKKRFELMFPPDFESNWVKPAPVWFQPRPI